ncbi:MAG: TraR/DksA C4-type zinc finger protein [Chloroflexi bacterium]|nr:TraR/DksA C4-type zinc finger protein [Chloroflexota bacterium]
MATGTTESEDEVTRLQHERERTLAEMQRLRVYLQYEMDQAVSEDDVDAASEMYERQKNLALLQTLEAKLESIEQALRVAQRGTYGICQACGKKIDPARLEIMPHATLCVSCQAKQERKGGRRPS